MIQFSGIDTRQSGRTSDSMRGVLGDRRVYSIELHLRDEEALCYNSSGERADWREAVGITLHSSPDYE